MIRRPPRSTRTDTLFPYTTLFRSFISGPVTDTLNIRLAGRSTYAGSWQKNYFSRPGDEFGKRREFAGRITLDWKPTDRLSFMASLSGWHDGSEPQIGQYIFLRPATAGQEQFLSPQLSNFETGTLVPPYAPPTGSEERRGGKECVVTCRSRWSRYHSQKKRQA